MAGAFVPRLTFSREVRLRRRSEFTACYEGGKRYHTEHFILFTLARECESPCRTGVAVSRKVGNAVVRNRVKRLLREFFRLHTELLPACLDIVAVAKRQAGAACLDLALVEAECLPFLKRLRHKKSMSTPRPIDDQGRLG